MKRILGCSYFFSRLEPHFCIICDRPCLKKDLCKRCADKLPWVTHSPPLTSIYIHQIQSLFAHEEPVTTWIHRLKYGNQIQLSSLLSVLMLEYLHLPIHITAIIPIPLHRLRLKERGYNQAELLVNSINKQLGMSHATDVIVRKKATQSQTTLKYNRRQNNVNKCFRLHPHATHTLSNEGAILLVDDVYTTGATLNEAAKTIKKHLANIDIYAWTISRSL